MWLRKWLRDCVKHCVLFTQKHCRHFSKNTCSGSKKIPVKWIDVSLLECHEKLRKTATVNHTSLKSLRNCTKTLLTC
jgi:hypothetical protein